MSALEAEHISQIRETVRRFVEKEIPTSAAIKWDIEDQIPQEVINKLGELGLMGITIPEEYGGFGRDIVGAMAVIEELSKRSIGAASVFIMAACYAGMNIFESGSEAQKQHYLPLIANGKSLFAYGLSEPDVGADLAMVKTRVEKQDDMLTINGAKRWCTGATIANNIFVLCHSKGNDNKYKNLNMVIVPTDTPGISITPLDVIGSRGIGTTDVIFDNVQVPSKNILGGEDMWDRGWEQLAGSTLDVEKLEVAAMALGNAEGALAEAWEYSQQREQFGVPISAHQAIRHRLASAKAKLFVVRQSLYNTAELANNNISCGVESSMVKLQSAEMCQEVVLAAQRVMGAYGCVRGEGGSMDQFVREGLVFPIAGGSSDIQLNNLANRLGLARKKN